MKNYFNQLAVIILGISILFLLQSCKKQENIKTSQVKPEVIIPDQPPGNAGNNNRIKVIHLRKDTVYILNNYFVREAGEQLIIDEGTLIKTNILSSITIEPGGIITANGNVANPIVFTSNAKKGTQGPNWGGIIIKGKSFDNANGSSGIADDFSGFFKYVRVEFAPVTLYAVGNKTVFENVMVSYTNREIYDQYQCSFNIYGGTFNAKYLISYACSGPADFFITNGYAGNMQNVIASRHPFFGKTGNNPDNTIAGIYIQNNSNNSTALIPYTNPIISNLTVIGPNNQKGSPAVYNDTTINSAALVTTTNACFHIRNSALLGFPAAGWSLNDSATAVNLLAGNGELNYSIIHSNYNSREFYLAPGTFSGYTSDDFRNYILGALFKNKSFNDAGDFMFHDINNYDTGPDLMPLESSSLLSGSNFDGPFFSNSYFDKNELYIGAIGKDDWLKNWTNFKPLKTNYNFPE